MINQFKSKQSMSQFSMIKLTAIKIFMECPKVTNFQLQSKIDRTNINQMMEGTTKGQNTKTTCKVCCSQDSLTMKDVE